MTLAVFGNLGLFALLMAGLYWQQSTYVSFNKRVFTGLGLGIAFGAALQALYGIGQTELTTTLSYIDIVGTGYIKLLQMIVMPLIMVSIISAIIKFSGGASLGKISALTISCLVLTTLIAASIGIGSAYVFGLSAEGLTEGAAELARSQYLQTQLASAQGINLPRMVLEFFPVNPFLDMTGARPTSTIAMVIFSAFIGVSAMGLARKKPVLFESFSHFITVAHALVMRMVTLVLRLTPFGVMALMTQVVSGSNYADILKLVNFVIASYAALATMFVVHLGLVALAGLNPLRYAKKILPVLSFAFTARTSAGAIPLNVQVQTQQLGISEGIANFSATFGATMGQNGCAGIYPAMLAVMIAPTVGVNPWDIHFLLPLLAIITVSSFGVAGVGGGATFAALIVLSSLNLPVALAGLLISIEPLIDMGRTALNVSGSVTAGTLTARALGELDEATFAANTPIQIDSDEIQL